MGGLFSVNLRLFFYSFFHYFRAHKLC